MWWLILACWAILVTIFIVSCYIGDRIAARNGAIAFIFDRFLLGVFVTVVITTGIAIIASIIWMIGVLFLQQTPDVVELPCDFKNG